MTDYRDANWRCFKMLQWFVKHETYQVYINHIPGTNMIHILVENLMSDRLRQIDASDFEYPDLPHHQNVQPSFSLICGFAPEGTMNEVRASKRGKILEANEKWLVNAHNTN